MSDYFNPLRDGGMNSVEDNTAALVRGAQSAVSVPAQRKEYAPKKPLAIPRTFTPQKQPVPMPNQDLQTASAPEVVPDADISPDTKMPSKENYWSRKSAEASALADIRARNAEHYNAVLPEHVYSAMNEQFKAVAREKGLSAAEEERARYMNAWQYHRLYGIPFSDALENLDEYNRAIFGADTDGMTYKGKMERLGDAWTSGMNSLRRSSLGKSLLNAELRGDDEGARLAWEAIDALDAENNTLAVSQPQSVGMSILTAGIQSLPYTAATMGAGIVSGLVGLGPLGSFAAGYDLMMHDEYISLRQAGADVETAQSVAAVSGVLQAAVESGLGVVARGAVQGAKSAGKKVVGNLTEKARKALTDRITKDIFTRYKMGGLAAAMASRFATDHIADTVEEGVEEYVQEWISGLSRHLADAMSDNDVESDDLGTIARNAFESFKGGIYGAVLLGVGDAAFGAYGTVSDYKNLRAAAEFIPSKEAFRKATSDNAAFAGMSDDEKTRVQDEIFSSFETKREQKASDEAAAIAEVNADEEGLEQTVFSDDGTEAEPAAEYRTDDGRLYVDNKVTAEDGNGLSEGVYRAGDPTRDGGNGYGYIKYTLDENEGKVTVETFAMSRSREGLRDELFRSFASDFSGYDIEWDAKLSRARAIRDRLISENPRGKGARLNYYASATDDDAEIRLSIARQLADNIPSLNAGERTAAVAFVESIARGLNESVSEFYERTFGDKIFGDARELAQAAAKTGQSVRGGMGYRQFGKDIRAVIYAGEKADFSTWVHEVSHAVRGRLSGDLLEQAEKAFGVADGKWTEAQEEEFAYGFEDFLRTGRAKSSALKNLYQKLAELISRIYGAMKERIQFSKDIEDTYNALLQGDDSVLARAEEAVRRADDEAKAKKRAESPVQGSNDSSDRMAQRIKEAAGNVMADPDAGTQEKTDAVLNAAGVAYDDEVMDLGDFIFQKSRAEDAESASQMEAVRQQYQGTDGWMKAPNGKPTNLTEKQWLQVRTPNFKRWFGDWENDPDESSKVVDENGEPLVVYHGSSKWFTVFNDGKTNKSNVNTPDGTIFANDNKSIASSFENYYGRKVKDVILDKDSPLHKRYDWGVYREGGVYSLFMNLRNPKVVDYNGRQWNADGMNINDEVAKAMQEGYDGFVAQNIIDVGFSDIIPPASNDYIAFNNTAVKSATDNTGAFDPHNPSILFQSGIVNMLFQEVSEAGTAINKDNYFKNTFIDWKITKAPDRQPDYKSDSGSEYWYTDKGVYRRSNHWGTVATCTWLLDGKSYKSVNRQSENKTEKIISDISGKTISDIGEKYGDKDVFANDGKNISWQYTLTGYSDFADIKKHYDMPFNDRVIKDILDTVKDVERQLSYDNKELTENEKNELIQSAIDDYKNGAGLETPETEADKQFIKELSLESYNSYDKEKPFIAFERGRFKSEPILFQIAGEIGAENLDNSEVQEGVSRMQNLAIAKQMETDGKDAKAIRLATGWEKGADGKWRWEIDDSKVHFDLYSAMEEWDNEHPRYKELLKKFFESELSEEEQEEFDKWVDERNYIQDKHTDLSFAEKLYGKDFRLPEVMNYPELFKAYPELKEITVSIKEQTGTAKGDANYEDKHINIYRAKEDTRGFDEWEKEAGSVLLHEVQHIIQRIEGFAKGANLDTFTPGIEAPELTKALAGFRTYSKEKLKNFSAAKEYQQYKDLGMSDAEIKELRPNIDGLGTIEEIIERDIKDHGVDWVYDEIQSAAEVVDNEGIIKVNGKKYVNNLDAYRSAAGEVESRNVQARMKLTPEERREALLAATEDVARDDQIILFQTNAELVESARQFGSWQDFMEYYEAGRDEGFLNPDEYSQVPQGADAEWYQTTWELANNAGPALSDDINTRRTKAAEEFSRDGTPEEMDALFTAHLASDPTLLDDFLRRVNELLTEEPIEHPQDEAEAAANERLLQMKRYIRTQLRHGSFVSNAQRLSGGKPLTQRARNTIMTLIRRAARDYRAIYAEIMDDDFFRVDEADTVTAQLKAAGLHDLTAGEGIEDASPEERRRIARKIQNEKMASALADGSFKIDSNLEAYIADLAEEIKAGKKALAELKEKTDEDWQRMSGWQERRILETYDRLLAARAKYDLKSDSVARRAESVAKTGEKYRDNRYDGIRADYESVFRQWNDLLKITKITEEMKAAVQRREDLYRLRERQKEKKSEHDAVQQLKDYRKRLVKRAFRRVPFERIDYESARTLIAIQRIFHPNMTGGVNRWIGTEGRWARDVWGSFHTDADERARIISILSRRKAGAEIIRKLEDTKTGEDFEKWTKKDRQRLYRAMSSDNWVRKLNLLGLEKEREESIQLDIRIDDAGRVRVGEDVEKMARDALGSDMYDAIVNRPFAEWTTEDMEAFAKKVDDIYVRGRNLLAARRQLEHERAAELRRRIEEAVQNTGIVINDDDPEDVKEKKRSEINRKLGKTSEVKGTAADRYRRQGIWNRLTQSYHDANIRRVARLLDNQGEGVNTALLYWRENDCFNAEERSKRRRIARIESAMKNAGISLPELYEKVVIGDFRGDGASVTFTVDELLYYAMANRDEMSREACMYGSMIDEKDRQKYRLMDEEDRKMRVERTKKRDEALAAGDEETARALSAEMAAEVDENGMHIPEGTAAYKEDCLVLWNKVLDAADEVLKRDGGKFRQFAEAISDDYTEEFDRIQEVSIAEFNQPVNRVDNYVPLIRKAYSGDTNENRVRADLMAANADALTNAGTDRGFTQRRIRISPLNQRPVESGLYSTWADAVERTEHFIAYAPYVRELNRVYNSRDAQGTMQWIESRFGSGMVSYIKDYIQEVANPARHAPQTALDRVVRSLRGRTAPAYLAWKASSVLKQALSSPAPFFQFVSVPEYVTACRDMMAHPQQTEELIKAKSAFMASRRFDPIADLIDEEAKKSVGNKWLNLMDRIGKTGMRGLEWIDWAAVAPGWLACYRKEYARLKAESEEKLSANLSRLRAENALLDARERMSDEEVSARAHEGVTDADEWERLAVIHADDKTRLCQPSNRSVDLAPMFKNGSEVQKALLQFTASLNVIWQNLRYDIPYAVRQKQYRQVVGIIAGYAAAGIALGCLAGDDGDDDDEARTVRNFIWNATTQFTDAVPIIGAVATSTAEKLITGHASFSRGTDLFPALTKYLSAAKEVTDGRWSKAAGHFAEGIGLTFGLPVSGAKEALYVAGIGDGTDGLSFHPTAVMGRRPK